MRTSALIPARSRPWPMGSRPRSTSARAGVRRACWRLLVRPVAAGCDDVLATLTKYHAPAGPGPRAPALPGPGPLDIAAPSPAARPSGEPRGGSRVKTFPTEKIRNVALVGHGGAGQDHARRGAAVRRRRDPAARDGSRTAPPSATSTPKRRGAGSRSRSRSRRSRSTGHKVNLIDTPGYADFVGDVAAALRAADLAVFVVSAVEGVEVQTEVAWRMAERARHPPRDLRQQARPRAGVVRAHARPAEGEVRRRRRAARAADRRGGRVPRRHRPARPTPRSSTTARRRQGRTGPVPDGDGDRGALASTTRSIEGIVVADDDLMERYLADETIAVDGARARARRRASTTATRVPGAVRQRDQAHRRRPARALHRRGGPAPHVDGRRPAGRVRVQDDRRPVRRAGEPVQGAAGHGEGRRDAA